jgi:hypothetical protein
MASYFGEAGTRPGLVLGADFSLLQLGAPGELFARGQVGGFVHPRLYWSLFAGGELGARATASFGLRGELALGAAYLHTGLASPVYEVDGGGVTRVEDAGRPGFMPSVSFGAGCDFGRRTGVPLAVMLRPVMYLQVPVNTSVLMHFAGLVSFTYTL